MYTGLRLKLIHFVRKNKKILAIIFLIWLVVFLINQMLKRYEAPEVPETTYTPHKSIMNSSSSTPNAMSEKIEKMIEEYIEYCNDGNYQKAYSMLSEDCKKYSFDDDIIVFSRHVLTKMPTKKKYSIQSYSNIDGLYIYQIKYTDNLLATGLTGQEYSYTEEKITFEQMKDGTILMSAGNFIRQADIKSVTENEYLKVDLLNKVEYYSMETYTVKLTNRSDYIIVIADKMETNEIMLNLPEEYRARIKIDKDVVLQPKESKEVKWSFTKFSDDGEKSQGIVLNAIRVMEKYSGVDVEDDVIISEIENSISKFSMQIPIVEK